MKKIMLLTAFLTFSTTSFASYDEACVGLKSQLVDHLDKARMNYSEALSDYNATVDACLASAEMAEGSERLRNDIAKSEKACEEAYADFSYRESKNEVLKCKIVSLVE